MHRLKSCHQQYLHLVTGGKRGDMYSLWRMDASRLFYPSTAEAEAAAAAAPLELGPMGADAVARGRLPRADLERGIHFQPPPNDDFLETGHGQVFARFGGGSRVLCADEAGHAAVYDAEAGSFVGMPAMSSRKDRQYVAVSIPRAGARNWADDTDIRGLRAHNLYVLDMLRDRNFSLEKDRGDYKRRFEVLAYHGDHGGGWKWTPLPPPPFEDAGPGGLTPYAVVGGGTTICVSTATATYTFDTVNSEWSKCGDWVLPSWGKAEHVPELGLWFAMYKTSYSRSGQYALDLSAAGAGCQLLPPPAMCGVGLDLELRDDLFLFNQAVASLGSGRLCVARFFLIMKQEHACDNLIGVFTGVEVVRGDDDGRLRVITHKSERFDEEFFRHLLL